MAGTRRSGNQQNPWARDSERNDSPVVSRQEGMGNTFISSADGNLCRGRPEPLPAGPGDFFWDDDLVSAAMVAPCVGHYFHCGFHADRDSPCSAVARLGICPPEKGEAPRHWDVAGVPAHAVPHRENW